GREAGGGGAGPPLTRIDGRLTRSALDSAVEVRQHTPPGAPTPCRGASMTREPRDDDARLFEELQVRTIELRIALEQQAATSEILRVISGSRTDVQPVFDAIVQRARRLCDAAFAAAFRFDGRQITFVAHHNMTDAELDLMRPHFPQPATRGIATGRA